MSGNIYTREHPQRKDYWFGELRSLGIDPKRSSDLNDVEELGERTDNLKQTMYQDYKTAYSDELVDKSRFDYII